MRILSLSRAGLYCLLLLTITAPATAATHRLHPKPPPAPTSAHPPSDLADLYSARVRRAMQSYLRLRLLQLREEQLDRVRFVIEHHLGVDALLAEPTLPPKDAPR
jgi:hypothetical protein